ncbi:unnamed protein product [Rangifer tarandus platyrhynchus]|uniref:Uncharacterized protein n=2 Tax=Rangifer tarandus platyrhynchus TaxID=3082113 RepID=A0ACB0FIJ9_RANTA|nr:unnamed protein product [Rangifer tarandus platyrhynchus]CAI9712885.1 unnamed protein product [Rangifer tarandus platyrhynchus]
MALPVPLLSSQRRELPSQFRQRARLEADRGLLPWGPPGPPASGRRSLRMATENVAPLGVGRGRTRRMAAARTLRRAVRVSGAWEGLWTPACPPLGLGATRIRDLR